MRIVLDIETSGLNPKYNEILEIAAVATDDRMQQEVGSYHALVQYTDVRRIYDECDDFVKIMHSKDNLWLDLQSSQTKPLSQIDTEFAAWIRSVASGTIPLAAGNNVEGFDLPFLKEWLPESRQIFHYRTVNISSLREIVHTECGVRLEGSREVTHRALADCRDSIALYHACLDALRTRQS